MTLKIYDDVGTPPLPLDGIYVDAPAQDPANKFDLSESAAQPPDILDTHARNLWLSIVDHYRLNDLPMNALDIPALTQLCCAYSRWYSASQALTSCGRWVEDQDGNLKESEPSKVEARSAKDFAALARAFNLYRRSKGGDMSTILPSATVFGWN